EMVGNVQIYGGFSGSENELTARDWHANPTLLQGNGSSVVRNPSSVALSRSARLDGFTITGGHATEGGGIYNATDATFANLIVRGNNGTGSGGGIRNFASGLYYNILITDNESPIGAGFFTTVADSEPVLVNITSSGNSGDAGPEFYHEAGMPTVVNSIFYGNGVWHASAEHPLTARHSLIQGRQSIADGNVDGRFLPMFANAGNGDFSLLSGSPAVNAGDNAAYVEAGGDPANAHDVAGNPRLVN